MRSTEHILLWKRVALYLQAGIRLAPALHACASAASNASTRKIITHLEEAVLAGEQLSVACARMPKQFPAFVVQVLSAGETSGTLINSLERVVSNLEQQQALKRMLMGAALYPLIIVLGTFGITLFLICIIFPHIIPILQELHTELPLPTRILLWVTKVSTHDWWILLLAGVAMVIITAGTWRVPRLRYARAWCLLHFPLSRQLLRFYILATLCSILGTLLQSGIRIVPVFALVRNVIANPLYQQAIIQTEQIVAEGSTVSSAIALNPYLFPTPMHMLIEAGEATGTLRTSFQYLGTHFQKELELYTKQLSILIEPLLMVAVGLGVGFIALAIVLPMYSITQGLSQ